jgi:Apea-like HEPN
MTDNELAIALRTDIVRPTFSGLKIFQATPADRTCFRYRYRLPKLVGGGDDEAGMARTQKLENRFNDIRSTIEEALALILPEPKMTTGRFVVTDAQWNPTADGGVAYQQVTVPRSMRMRRVEMDAKLTLGLQELWHHLSRRDLVQRHKGLALALRRLSYQAQRERPEDELLDTIIAAEGLYLTGLGNESYRGELRYRLSLRAALWADADQLGLSKREVLKLMQSAYDVRSAIAHGGTPDRKLMKIQGNRVELPELVTKTKAVISAGCRKALAAAASGEGWPPDWEALALPDQ